MRIKIIRLIVIVLFLAIASDLIYVQILKGRYYFDLSRNNRIRVVLLEGKRGRILDRQGIVLAENRLSYNVSVVPQEIEDEDELFDYLGETLKENPQILKRKFIARRFAPFAPVMITEDVARDTAIALEENKFRFPGLLIEESFRRFYPFSLVNAHVLGYVGKINPFEMNRLKGYGYTTQNIVGKSGVEEYYDNFLRGEQGGLQIEVNSRGQQVRMLGFKSPSSGEDITLTIDHRIQKISNELLAGRPGAVAVMDMNNGEILAMTSSPSFDPNIFARRTKESEAAYIFNNPAAPLLNRVIGGQYPPGSVFKVVVTMAGLETGKIHPNTSFVCPGYYQIGGQQFHCSHAHGLQDLTQAIARSCNVYFFHVAEILGADILGKYARIFGLGSPTYVDLPYEAQGFIPSPLHRKLSRGQNWYKGDTLNFSIGQGDVLVTPLQLVHMLSMIAMEGRDVHPHVIKTIGAQPVQKYSIKNGIVLKEKNLREALRGLRAAVSDDEGTAHFLNINGLSVSGKTGTAQTSGNRDHHAWFVGFTKTQKQQIAFCVFLEYGGSSLNAVETAHELLLRMQAEDIL